MPAWWPRAATSQRTAAKSLQVTTADGGWFVAYLNGIDLSSKSKIKLDLKTTNAGTSTGMAIQTGDGWTWCQSSWGWVNGGTTTTVEFDLNSLGCATPELNKVQAINVWFSGERRVLHGQRAGRVKRRAWCPACIAHDLVNPGLRGASQAPWQLTRAVGSLNEQGRFWHFPLSALQ